MISGCLLADSIPISSDRSLKLLLKLLRSLNLQLLLNFSLVFLWHQVLLVRDRSRFVDFLLGHFTKYLNKRRNLDLLGFSGCLNSQNWEWEAFNIQESINHEVLLIIDKALSEFFDNLLSGVFLFQKFNIFSRSNLPFLYDTLLVLHQLSLMIVNKGIILADFPDDIINLFFCRECQKCLLNIEVFLFHITWHHNIIVVLVSNEQEFLDKSRGWRQSDEFQYGLQAVIYFALEAQPIILDDTEMWVADPRVNQFLVEILSLFDAFISCLIILIGEKLFRTLGRSDEVDNRLVSSISELHSAPASFVQDCLPDIFICVSWAIHHTSIT